METSLSVSCIVWIVSLEWTNDSTFQLQGLETVQHTAVQISKPPCVSAIHRRQSRQCDPPEPGELNGKQPRSCRVFLACRCGACGSRSTDVALKKVLVSLRSGSNKKTTATLTSGSEGSLNSRCSSISFGPRMHTQVKRVFTPYLARYAVHPFPILRSTKRQGAFASPGPAPACHCPAQPLLPDRLSLNLYGAVAGQLPGGLCLGQDP